MTMQAQVDHERTMTIEEVLRFAWPWIIGMTLASFVPHMAIHGLGAPSSAVALFLDLVYLIAAYAIGVVVHEALHVVGMLVFGRVSWRSVTGGHRISEGVVYVHTTQPMSARAYRGVLVLPGILTGIVPVLIGWITGSWWLTIYGWLMTTSAVGDIAIIRLIRDLSSDTPVQDHPEKVGMLVLKREETVTEEAR
jgi:hypothetical protein